MRSVKLNKKELLDIVVANKAKHIAEYEEAVVDYMAAVISIAKSNLKLAKEEKLNAEFEGFPSKPKSYEKDYTRAIRMLELSVEEEITLEEDIFNQLVLDEWSWKNMFSASNAFYKSYTTGVSR